MRVSILLYFLVCVHSLYAQQYFFSRYTPRNGLVNNRGPATSTRTAKHAQAGCVWIFMDPGRELTLIIQDDGVGFDKGRVRPFSNGLGNMQRWMPDIASV